MKLARIGVHIESTVKEPQVKSSANSNGAEEFDSEGRLKPEKYNEDSPREIIFTERELNGLISRNSELAKKVAIDLSDDLVSAKILTKIPEDFPIMPGETVRLRAGLELLYEDGRPVVALAGVSVMGVPLPNSWTGGIKNVDLIREYGGRRGLWKSFADGVDEIEVREGLLRLKLKE